MSLAVTCRDSKDHALKEVKTLTHLNTSQRDAVHLGFGLLVGEATGKIGAETVQQFSFHICSWATGMGFSCDCVWAKAKQVFSKAPGKGNLLAGCGGQSFLDAKRYDG